MRENYVLFYAIAQLNAFKYLISKYRKCMLRENVNILVLIKFLVKTFFRGKWNTVIFLCPT